LLVRLLALSGRNLTTNGRRGAEVRLLAAVGVADRHVRLRCPPFA
jgi:hypothetical protein